jgi:putative ABC transport system ATP-binding protein
MSLDTPPLDATVPGPPTAAGHAAGAVIRLEGVSKIFQPGALPVVALRDVTLAIRPGEMLAVAGPSGSGKTTLLNLIGGLDTPSAGSIWYRERDLATFGPRELTEYRRSALGFVFQFFNLIPNLTARENIEIATQISDRPRDVGEVLQRVGLADRAGHFPSQLSGGEQQRVAIARAVAKNPDILLCDEPTGALDFETGKRVLRVLWDVNRELGTTVVLITHNLAIAAMADRLLRMRSGEVVQEHRPERPQTPEEIAW